MSTARFTLCYCKYLKMIKKFYFIRKICLRLQLIFQMFEFHTNSILCAIARRPNLIYFIILKTTDLQTCHPRTFAGSVCVIYPMFVNTVSFAVPSESYLKCLLLDWTANHPVYNLTPTLTSINCLLIFPPGTLQYCRFPPPSPQEFRV